MIPFKTIFTTAVVGCGVLGMATAQQVGGDAIEQAGNAAQQAGGDAVEQAGNAAQQAGGDAIEQAGDAANSVETEAAATADARLNTESAAQSADAAVDGSVDADRAQGSISGQTEAASPIPTPTQRANAEADLNVSEQQAETSVTADAEAAATTTADETLGNVRGEVQQQTEINDRQLNSETAVDSTLNTNVRDEALRLQNRADAAVRGQINDQLQNSAAGLTFRSDTNGIFVDNVADSSAAARLGLQQGDEIVRFNGQWVNDRQELQRLMSNVNNSRPIDIAYRRNGLQYGRQITLNTGAQTQTALRPNYDNVDNASGSAGVNANVRANGQLQGQTTQQAGYSHTVPSQSIYYYGSPGHNAQPYVTYGGVGQTHVRGNCCGTERVKHHHKDDHCAPRTWNRCCR